MTGHDEREQRHRLGNGNGVAWVESNQIGTLAGAKGMALKARDCKKGVPRADGVVGAGSCHNIK